MAERDVEGILKEQVYESHGDFDQELGVRGMEALTPVFESQNTPAEMRANIERVLSGEDGSVALPADAARALSEADLLKGYTLVLGKKPENMGEGWCEAGTIKHTRRLDEPDSHGVWQDYRVAVPGIETPIMTEVWLKAREQTGTLDRDYTTWILSRGPLGSGMRIQMA